MRSWLQIGLFSLLAAAGCGGATNTSDGGAADSLAPADLVNPGLKLSFAQGVDYPAGVAPSQVGYPVFQVIVSGDFDGDKAADLAVPNPDDVALSILYGDGKGGFAAPLRVGTKGRATWLAAEDLDGDGRSELLVGYDGDVLSVVHCRANRLCDAPIDTAWPDSTDVIAAGDFNGDGLSDVAAAPHLGASVTVGLGDGKGGLVAQPAWGFKGTAITLAAGDLDGNGSSDLLLSEDWQVMDVLLAAGAGDFAAAAPYELDHATVDASAVGDFDGDGKVDAVVTPSTVGVQFMKGNGKGGFVAGGSYPLPGHSDAAAAIDLNLDGHLDLVLARDLENEVAVLLGDGAGGFGAGATLNTNGAATGVALADFDGDGLWDVAASEAMGGIRVFLNRGHY